MAVAIPEEDVARVRAATDIVALIGEHAALKQQGTRWSGLCPFHQEKSPSFSVNAEEGLYYCFGCKKSGDAISFVREVEHLDFVEAVRQLADRAGVTITEDAAVTAERQKRNPLYDAVAQAVDFYHQRLLTAPDGGPARDYLRSRGYDGDVVRAFKIGWAPEGWDALASHLKVSERVLTESGLGFVNRRGRRQDAFRGRVIFPIFDPSGKAIALGGRILPPPAGSAVGQRRTQVQELPGRSHLRQAPHPLRSQLGQDRRGGQRRGHRLRGLHRRHRLLRRRSAPGRGHLRHRPGRGALPGSRQLRHPHGPGLRRRRRR